ncbi:right-handed parallel beta-helix repeat-containing protein [Desulforhopalus sp. 52FAK]
MALLIRGSVVWVFIVLSSISSSSIAGEKDSILDFLPAIIAGINKLPRAIDFKVESPAISSDSLYVIDLERWDIPNNGINSEKTTDNLQRAIDWASHEGYGRVVLPAGHYLIGKYGNDIYQSGIDLHGNTEFVMTNATLEMAANDKWNYCVLRAQGVSNVIINGGTIKGDRDNHIFTPRSSDGSTTHDEGHGICVWGGSERILVRDMNIHSLTGDGSLLLNSNNVHYTSNTIYNNRRQGISVVGGIKVAIDNNEIHHIRGTSPQFGVDIEGAGREDRDILIRNNYFHHNRGGDIVNTSGKNVFIVKNIMDQGTEGVDHRYIDGPIVTWERTDNVIALNRITMYNGSVNGRLGFIQYSGDNDNNQQTTYVHDNIFNNCGMYMYKAEGADIRNNKFLGYFLALSHFKNVVLVDNLVTYSESGPRYCWSYRFNNVTGFASGNYVEDQPANIPLSETIPHTLQCVLDGF